MTHHTCTWCDTPFTREAGLRGAPPKYCSPLCRRRAGKANEKPSTKPCSAEGCTKPLKAKGLCGSHYNQKHHPDRHPKTVVNCTWCATPVLKAKSNRYRPTCSDACKAYITWPPKSDLPKDHWALWYGTTSAWPRHALTQCDGCNEMFAPARENETCCTKACKRLKALLDSGSMTEAMRATIVRECDTCDEDYTSPYVGQTSCDACRTKRKRSHWITNTRRQALYKRDRWMCHLCGDRTNTEGHYLDDGYPTLDHLVPRSKGGTHEDYNLATCCRQCNTMRGVDDLPMLQLC